MKWFRTPRPIPQPDPAIEVVLRLRDKARGGLAYDPDPDTAADIIEEYLLDRDEWEDPSRDNSER